MSVTKGFAAILVALACVAFGAASAGGARSSGGSKLAPVGATQPSAAANLPACDLDVFGPPGGQEGACRSTNETVVAADRAHAVALKLLTLDIAKLAPVARIRIGSGSIGPLDPNTNAWIAFTVHVKNTSGRAATFRDEQINLRLGATQYPTHPEATSSEPDSLTKANHKIGNGKTVTGSVVFEVPNSDLGLLAVSPTALLFTGFGGDFDFNQFPGGAVGAIRLYK
jgi:Domain of unknown function (DUF4352)